MMFITVYNMKMEETDVFLTYLSYCQAKEKELMYFFKGNTQFIFCATPKNHRLMFVS